MLARVTRAAAARSVHNALTVNSISSAFTKRSAQQTPATAAAAHARRFASKRNATPQRQQPPPSEPVVEGPPRPRATKEELIYEAKEMLKLAIGGTAAIIALVTTSGYVIETTKQWNPIPAPGTMVHFQDAEGRPVSVHMQKQGSGQFTVIFDGGVGETSFDWDKVMDEVAKFATVVCIDRPGLGFSPPGPLPRTSMQVRLVALVHIASEYKQLLKQLNISPQVILVGHGAGGYNMRQLAEELEGDANDTGLICEGLVLVDALQEDLRRDLESVSPAVQESLETMDANGETVLNLSRFGVIRMINNIQRDKFVKRYSPIALPYVEYFLPSPAHRQGALWENQAIPLTEERFRNTPTFEGFEFPCVVLSHSEADMFDGMKANPGIDIGAISAMERKWQDAQDKLAEGVSSQPSVHIRVPDVGHNIQHDQPEEITRVVRALVAELLDGGSVEGLKSL